MDPKPRKDGENGAAMVEFALAFPLQLLVFLLGVQLCLIIVGKQVVNWAAFCAARAEVVGENPADAAAFACIPIGGVATSGSAQTAASLPGWEASSPDFGLLSQRAKEKTLVEVLESRTAGTGRVVARVRYSFEMMIPLANWVIFYGLDGFNPGLVHMTSVEASGTVPNDAVATVIGGVPHLILQEETVLAMLDPKPTAVGHDIITDPDDAQNP
jgi:Flp pilus assembly protein TadG